jgi:transposase
MGKSKKLYDEEFKKQTIQYLKEEKKSLTQVARETGIPVTTLTGWRSKYGPSERTVSSASGPLTESQELQASKKRIRDLEEEVAILKKAVAIFTKNPR